uniref:hypothetical protein n=1 Tax=Amycolatopsis sp. CA-290885 TaxID=3239925 RepID=UPI003F49A5EF
MIDTTTITPNVAAGDDWFRPGLFVQPTELPPGASWGHQPQHHNGSYVYPGRSVLVLPDRTWLYEPERCQHTGRCEVLLGGDLVICPGCGLDET